LYFTMHAISTAAFVSVLALVPSLAAAIPATNPTQQTQLFKRIPFRKCWNIRVVSLRGASRCGDAHVLTVLLTPRQAEPCDTLVAKLGLSQA
ncbi:hypothetical protein EDB85DRAFT_1948761, partial [Lactarius pseudohatsudake]